MKASFKLPLLSVSFLLSRCCKYVPTETAIFRRLECIRSPCKEPGAEIVQVDQDLPVSQVQYKIALASAKRIGLGKLKRPRRVKR